MYTTPFDYRVIYDAVVEFRVVVMDSTWVHAVVEVDILPRDALAEVSLEAVDA